MYTTITESNIGQLENSRSTNIMKSNIASFEAFDNVKLLTLKDNIGRL